MSGCAEISFPVDHGDAPSLVADGAVPSFEAKSADSGETKPANLMQTISLGLYDLELATIVCTAWDRSINSRSRDKLKDFIKAKGFLNQHPIIIVVSFEEMADREFCGQEDVFIQSPVL